MKQPGFKAFITTMVILGGIDYTMIKCASEEGADKNSFGRRINPVTGSHYLASKARRNLKGPGNAVIYEPLSGEGRCEALGAPLFTFPLSETGANYTVHLKALQGDRFLVIHALETTGIFVPFAQAFITCNGTNENESVEGTV